MTTETKIIDGVPYVRADLALPMPVLREAADTSGCAASADLERFAFDARQAMLDYGGACISGETESIRDSTTRACAAIDALKMAAAPAPDRSAQVAEVKRLIQDLLEAQEQLTIGWVESPGTRNTKLRDTAANAARAALESAVKRLAGVE